jgi:hypothetical protein
MHLQKIEVSNVLGLARADIAIGGGVLLVAGDNGSGKTSLRDAISMALTGEPCRVSKKKDLDKLLHNGAKKGRATVYSAGEILGEIKLPKGEFAGPDFAGAEYLPLVLSPSKFAAMTNDERRAMLFKVTGCKIGKSIEPLLIKRGIDMALFAEVQAMLRSGFPAAAKYAQEQARDAKADWKAITGEQWGSEKAESWEVELPTAAAPTDEQIKAADAAVEKVMQDIANGQAFLGQLQEQKRTAAAEAQRIEVLREQAGNLERAKAKLASTETDLAVWVAKAADLAAQLAAAENNAGGCECPSCGAHLKIEGAHLKVYQPTAEPTAQITTLEPKLKEAVNARDMLQRAQRNDMAAIAAAEQAAAALQEAEAAPQFDAAKLENTELALAQLKQSLASEQAKEHALNDLRDQFEGAAATTQKAAAVHAKIAAWLAIADAMLPDGVPGDLLKMALAPINQSLELLANLAEWPIVTITPDIEITVGERAYLLASESQQWRADAMIGIAIAQLTGLRMVMLDRFDVLSLAGRGQLLGMVCELVDMGSMDTVIMLGTMKEIPKALPGQVTPVWISGGIAEAPAA